MNQAVLRPIRGRPAYLQRECGEPTACWLWNGSTNSKGYPLRSIDGRVELVHRIVAGASDGQSVHHVCAQPSCVNPEHLVLVENEREHKAKHGDLLIDRILRLVSQGLCRTQDLYAALPENRSTISVDLWRAQRYGVLRRVDRGIYEVVG